MSVDEKGSFLSEGKKIKEVLEAKEVGTPVKEIADDTLSLQSAQKVVIFNVLVMPYMMVISSSY